MASKFKDLPDISTTQPDRLIKYRVSEDRFSAEVLLPGLSYTDFDQKIGGKVSLWSISKLFEGIGWQALKHGYFYHPKFRMIHDRKFFIASQTCTLTKRMHDICYSNTSGLNKPLLASVYAANIGKSSKTKVTDLYEYHSGEKLATFVTVTVYVDAVTRRPQPLPDFCFENFEDHLKNIENKTMPVKKLEVLQIPSSAFKYTVKALHSDTDMNQHVNQCAYIKWCSDAASMGARKGYFTNFKKHIECYPLKSSVIQYTGESLVNDLLIVNVWEAGTQNKALNFAITKNGKMVCVMKMEFYEGKISLWSLAKVIEGMRWQAMKNGFFYSPELIKPGKMAIFVASQSITFNTKLHTTLYNNTFGLYKPLLARTYVSNVGKSSFTTIMDLYEYRSGIKLCSVTVVTVLVNSITRKPLPLPAFFYKNFEEHSRDIECRTLNKSEIPQIPVDAFKYTVKALHSDSDSNHHANQATYIRWCSDAASMGARKGYFANFNKHIERYPSKCLVFQYIGESLVNDNLTVNVWEADQQNKALQLAITQNTTIIFIMKMEFYEGEPIQLAPHLEAKL